MKRQKTYGLDSRGCSDESCDIASLRLDNNDVCGELLLLDVWCAGLEVAKRSVLDCALGDRALSNEEIERTGKSEDGEEDERDEGDEAGHC